MQAWLLALVPLAVLLALVAQLALRTRRGDFGERSGRRRAPWVLPVLAGAAAWALLRLVTR